MGNNMGEWPLVVSIFAVLIGAFGAVAGTAMFIGGLKERLRVLEQARSALDTKVEAI